MIVLYIFLGLLLFLFLLTLIPVRIDVAFREEFALTVRYLFLRLPILPPKEETEEEKKKKEQKKEKKEQKKKKKQEKKGETEEEGAEKKKSGGLQKIKAILKEEGFFGFLKALFEIVGMAANTTRKVISKIKVRRFDLYLCLGGAEDAAAAAILYGQLSGAVYGACSFLFSLTGCRKRAVTLDMDYSSSENTVDFSGRISIRPSSVLKEGISLLIKCVPYLLRFLRAGSAKKNPKERVSQLRKQGNEQ